MHHLRTLQLHKLREQMLEEGAQEGLWIAGMLSHGWRLESDLPFVQWFNGVQLKYEDIVYMNNFFPDD
ncbi:hypothetical protein NA56DRAFT_709651 [Hyaloscypha hepaticicola]|uniref:Uncharacterized protein n=1 Tax=Hyaloscypha hepaticicola TaxID=2082293 RepID=A0A2J6PNB7_9HELO|nr:hypothetical protein NA56DRAFT_709651 [Hyaloscypha hepaticicola]